MPLLPGRPHRVLLLGGTSEIGLAIVAALGLPAGSQLILAGRDIARLAEAGDALGGAAQTTAVTFDATATGTHQALIDHLFTMGSLDIAICVAGILVPQEELDHDVQRAATMIETNFTGHVTTLLALAARMRDQGTGTIVVLSSIAATRPRRANPVYGSAKAGLDAFTRGLTDSLHGTGVRVLLVRPGFVIGRMTEGMRPAPLATTPRAVGAAVAAAVLNGSGSILWVPSRLRGLAALLRVIPRPLWRRISRLDPAGRFR